MELEGMHINHHYQSLGPHTHKKTPKYATVNLIHTSPSASADPISRVSLLALAQHTQTHKGAVDDDHCLPLLLCPLLLPQTQGQQ